MKLRQLNRWNTLNRLDQIELYFESGLQVTPLIVRGKTPFKDKGKEWLEQQTQEQLLTFFRENPDCNVGCWMPENLVCVDVDYPDDFYAINGGEDYDTLKSKGRRGIHYWFLHNGNIGSCNGVRRKPDGLGILDYRSHRNLMVLPPSVHHSGVVYKWDNLIEPIEAPPLIYELYETRREHSLKVAANNPRTHKLQTIPDSGIHQTGNIKRLFALTDKVKLPEGSRYPELYRHGRRIRWTSSFEQMEEEIRRLNKACCQPPLPEWRLKKLIHFIKTDPDTPEFKARAERTYGKR